MKVSFDKACKLSATEFHLLAARAEDPGLFAHAVERMGAERWTCDTETGVCRNRDGAVSRFPNYDWAAEYDSAPHFIFYDFFRGPLLNKYSRLVRGVDARSV